MAAAYAHNIPLLPVPGEDDFEEFEADGQQHEGAVPPPPPQQVPPQQQGPVPQFNPYAQKFLPWANPFGPWMMPPPAVSARGGGPSSPAAVSSASQR